MSLPEKMRVALLEGVESLSVVEAPMPTPRPDDVVVRVEVAGICGSDLHSYAGHSLRGRFDEWRQLGLADGHELSGRVVAKGTDVTSIDLGAFVTAEAVWHCGVCAMCTGGQYHICLKRQDLAWRGHGAFAEYAFLPERAVYELPESLTATEGALVEPLAASCHAVQRSGLRVGDNVLVIGAGSTGLLASAVALNGGARSVGVLARYPHQAEAAKILGVSAVALDGERSVAHLASELAPIGFDRVIDTTGTCDGFASSVDAARKGGTVVLAGGYATESHVHLGSVVGKELRILGSLCYGCEGVHRDFGLAMDLMANGRVAARSLVTHTLSFDRINDAFKIASDKKSGAIKVHVDFEVKG